MFGRTVVRLLLRRMTQATGVLASAIFFVHSVNHLTVVPAGFR